jgi:hypothetical protein
MDILQAILDEQVRQLPRLLAKEFLADKLRGSDVVCTDDLLERLTDHCMSGSQEVFRWDDNAEDRTDVEITISDADLTGFNERVSRFLDQLPSVVQEIATKSARMLAQQLKKNWPTEEELQQIERSEFRQHMEEYWGNPLNMLRMLVTVAREIISDGTARKQRSKTYQALPDVLLRLNVRACQITSKIIVLLKNGFADGAMARWRSLYEVSVVAMVIVEGGETLARRYVDHQHVERKEGEL